MDINDKKKMLYQKKIKITICYIDFLKLFRYDASFPSVESIYTINIFEICYPSPQLFCTLATDLCPLISVWPDFYW